MKSSVIALISGAAVALASPAVLNKRVYEVQWTTVYTTATVTAGQEPTQAPVVEAPVAPPPEAVVVTVTKGPSVEPIAAPTTKEDAPIAAPTYAPPTGGSMEDTALYHHNVHRSNHSAPAMSWNSDIANAAQVAADSCKFEHQMGINGLKYGQNLAMWGTSANAAALGADGAIAKAASDMWYAGEFASYASYFGKEPSMSDFHSWGHLSQLLWAESTGLGCAVKLCKKGTMYDTMDAWYMVCNYEPAGNMGGAYAKNVKAPLGQAPVSA
ncbi:CAP domain-containing protein [Microdochium trichocladiopsis]|uniref:CAP domain-containing protein n=1 Tax=Microdochium trichocladiopsis TaxID=1682393 RepID=A0A9P8YE72_9PEZI|nr:CAP domain-containing protein [Microdochium trichocladiopsis]KAH7037252.1 CAP domain-containing protein [Microdochium trichocladiopsis]